MSTHRAVPNLQADDPGSAGLLYRDVLGLEPVMDLGWITTYAAPDAPHVQLSLVSTDASAPVVPDVSVEVDDVDGAFAAAQRHGVEVVHGLTDEPWGVRRFFFRDPASGRVINVVAHR